MLLDKHVSAVYVHHPYSVFKISAYACITFHVSGQGFSGKCLSPVFTGLDLSFHVRQSLKSLLQCTFPFLVVPCCSLDPALALAGLSLPLEKRELLTGAPCAVLQCYHLFPALYNEANCKIRPVDCRVGFRGHF